MARFIIKRLLQLIPVFFGATFLIFALVFAIPGDPLNQLAGDRPLSEPVMEALREQYNLNDPLIVQYGKYIGGLFQGDFGMTFNRRPVVDIIAQRFPITIRLSLVAIAIEIVIGVIAGIMAGIRRKSFMDQLVLVSTTLVVSIPVLVIGFVAQIAFGLQLGWFPISGVGDGWYGYLLPGFVLASTSTAYLARLLRTSLVENLRADYVRTATAKGLSRKRVIGRHALRNSLIPVVTFIGVDLGSLMGGAIITEGIFNIPGVGGAVFDGIRQQEGTVVVGIVTLLVLVFVFANLIVDLMYAVLDPRIRHE